MNPRFNPEWKCPTCGSKRSYSEEYDSFYCSKCNEWLEIKCKCGGNNCIEYPNRPNKPRCGGDS